MYSRQSETFLGQHAEARERLRATVAEIAAGEAWGARVADAILLARAADGSDEAAAYTSTGAPFDHGVAPVSRSPDPLGVRWGRVTPFCVVDVLARLPGVPWTTDQYTVDHAEALAKGRATGSTRTPEETEIGIFWAYDSARGIGVPHACTTR